MCVRRHLLSRVQPTSFFIVHKSRETERVRERRRAVQWVQHRLELSIDQADVSLRRKARKGDLYRKEQVGLDQQSMTELVRTMIDRYRSFSLSIGHPSLSFASLEFIPCVTITRVSS